MVPEPWILIAPLPDLDRDWEKVPKTLISMTVKEVQDCFTFSGEAARV